MQRNRSLFTVLKHLDTTSRDRQTSLQDLLEILISNQHYFVEKSRLDMRFFLRLFPITFLPTFTLRS
jgi:hypothetical protein